MVSHYTDSIEVMGPSKNISSNSQFKSSQSEKNLSSITGAEDESNEVLDTEVLPESELPFESPEYSENESQELNENDDNRNIIISDGNICNAGNSSGDISDNRELNNSCDNIGDNREYDISVNEESERYFVGSIKPKVKQFVEYQLKDTNDLKCVQITSRGGKATGKYSSSYNVRNVTDDVVEPIDWNNVQKWKPHVLYEEVLGSNIGIDDIDLAQAKFKELQKWKENNVYDTVPYRGQKLISVKWVNTSKANKSALGSSWFSGKTR